MKRFIAKIKSILSDIFEGFRIAEENRHKTNKLD